jgi:NAD(P) transhydrogenase
MRQFDLCVIGSGPAGQRAAIQAAKLGKRVCVVERREVVGGNAISTGTIPSKALREAILSYLASGGGREPLNSPGGGGETDFAAARNRTFTGLWDSANRVIKAEIDIVRRQLASNGVEIISGNGAFRDATTIDVQNAYASTEVKADKFLIAVGTDPTRPPNIPFDNHTVITSDELVKLPYLPHSIIVVGGGVIGTEYASMLAALGVKVTLLEGRARLLDFVDAEITEALQYHLRQSGMTLRLGERVVKISKIDPMPGSRPGQNQDVQATLESGKVITADALLYCIGRGGATERLNLAAAGLAVDDRGRIKVNEHFQTQVKHIYAAGDVIGFPALASTSMEQGRLAACHMFGVKAETVSTELPYGIYSIPEISMCGWTEERLTKDGIPFESGIGFYRETARGQLLGDMTGMLKLLIDQESHAILGVHVIGTNATELLHIGQTAMAFKGTAEYFVNTVFNYPTLAECYKVAAMNGLNKLRNV